MNENINVRKAELLKGATEEALFANVMEEMERGEIRKGLWAKALILTDGDNERANAKYIKLRVQSIIDEYEIAAITEYELSEKKIIIALKKKRIADVRQAEELEERRRIARGKATQGNMMTLLNVSLIFLGVTVVVTLMYLFFSK